MIYICTITIEPKFIEFALALHKYYLEKCYGCENTINKRRLQKNSGLNLSSHHAAVLKIYNIIVKVCFVAFFLTRIIKFQNCFFTFKAVDF